MKVVVPEGKILVQFDGMCLLCSKTIKIILKADRKKKFIFQSLQNSKDNKLPDSVIVSDNNKTYSYFDAVLKIAEELGGIYRLAFIFKLIPKNGRNLLYQWVARNRYRWFGVRQSCYLPKQEERERFI